MPFPLAAVLGAASGVAGYLSDKKKNKRAKEQLKIDRDLANQQIDISKYIQGLSKELVAKGSNVTDPYGNTAGYDAASGSYKAPMRPGEIAVQNASDQEELARNTVDQEMRRRALQEAENRRANAGVEANQAMRDISLFKQGIGAVDPTQLASSMRLARTAAVNAGYDDTARAATTLGLRTGSASVGSALERLSRDRARAQIEGLGNPELEGLQLADEMNKTRLGQKVGLYDMYNTNANQVYDAPFAPSNAADKSFDKSMALAGLDLNKYATAMGGSGTAAAGIGSAAQGQRAGFATSEANRVQAPFANLLGGLGSLAGGLGGGKMDLSRLFGG